MDTDDLAEHGTIRTFLAPFLLVAASLLSLAGIGLAATHRLSAPAGPATCARVTSLTARSGCP
ncbi:hypothetical protein OHA72_41315 [Dactylosporangium sp. NBC_01737]|uniref:hypothetical protein n=1 Tax=Dactylosporangium sp. NBC_01737 TaxID=2975959 RepID=UPI002E0E6A52|nr:hypothetical protein OHA72_41315 [Dactylosporangium sp. NBC_01737]